MERKMLDKIKKIIKDLRLKKNKNFMINDILEEMTQSALDFKVGGPFGAVIVKDDDIVLIHDGVRPLINEELITRNIETVKNFGNAITVEPAKESVVRCDENGNIVEVPLRANMYTAKAPQSFRYNNILKIYEQAHENGIRSIDSAHLCSTYGVLMHTVLSTRNNIKITEPADYYVYRALYEAIENQQIFGI